MVEVLGTEESEAWFMDLEPKDAEAVYLLVGLLEDKGTTLGRPYSSAIVGSKYGLRELRVQSGGKPLRVSQDAGRQGQAMKTKRWSDIRRQKFSPKKIEALDRTTDEELEEMDLRELREASGKTQEEVAAALKKTQPEVSRLERRSDYRLSTLEKLVKALGGKLEVVANFGNRRVRLRAAG